jgi:DNA-binding CsgD family transcriptional regulator
VGVDARARGVARIAEFARHATDAYALFGQVQPVITSVVPDVAELIWKTIDPATLIGTSSFTGRGEPTPADIFVWEYLQDDYIKTIDAIRTPDGQLTLDEATAGEIDRSPLYRDVLRPNGLRHVVETVLRDRTRQVWGSFTLVRSSDRPAFDRDELTFLRAVAPHLARGVRRGMLVGGAGDPDSLDAPAMIVIDHRLDVESMTPGARRWIAQLPGYSGIDHRLPTSVMSVACAALGRGHATARRDRTAHDSPMDDIMVRVRTSAGRWIALHGAPLDGSGPTRAAVLIEPAHPGHVFPLLMHAYGLTLREQEVTRLVLLGESTRRIATSMNISPHTVQEHLKHIFDKTGVRSRRELTGAVFVDFYARRVADNGHRATEGLPLRSGPIAAIAHGDAALPRLFSR